MIARFSGFTLDSEQRRLMRTAREIHLTPKAFDLLVILIEEAPRVVRKTELHERLWPDSFVSDVTLVGLIKELRRALNDRSSSARVIRTAHRVGYALAAPVETPRPSRLGISYWIVAGTRKIPLQEGDTLIGRDPAANVRVEAEGVSRRHACITLSQAGAVIEDLGSKNGTRVNEGPLQGPTRLSDGDRVGIGATIVVFHALASGRSTETLAKPARSKKRKISD